MEDIEGVVDEKIRTYFEFIETIMEENESSGNKIASNEF